MPQTIIYGLRGNPGLPCSKGALHARLTKLVCTYFHQWHCYYYEKTQQGMIRCNMSLKKLLEREAYHRGGPGSLDLSVRAIPTAAQVEAMGVFWRGIWDPTLRGTLG